MIFMVPPAILFIHSAFASSVFLVVIFSVSAWNGATFYVEVFGRKFERELERLRKEMELASASGTSLASTAATPSAPSTPYLDVGHPSPSVSVADSTTDGHNLDASPLMLPGTKENAADMEIPELTLSNAEMEANQQRKKTV